jgi:hypothetical protein
MNRSGRQFIEFKLVFAVLLFLQSFTFRLFLRILFFFFLLCIYIDVTSYYQNIANDLGRTNFCHAISHVYENFRDNVFYIDSYNLKVSA